MKFNGSKHNFEDLTGKHFRRWVVLGPAGFFQKRLRTKGPYWYCKCDCGTQRVVCHEELIGGRSQSCGCVQREVAASALLPQGRAAFNKIIAGYKRNAKSRGYDWNLTEKFVKTIMAKPCYYCGQEPTQRFLHGNSEYIYNGLDRIDNTKGYTFNNMVSCCKQCNWAKKDLFGKKFLSWIKRVFEHFNEYPSEDGENCRR